MKKISFELVKYEDLFSIHLGNQEWIRFESKSRAEAFLRQYKKIIRENVQVLNLMQPQLNAIYRQNVLALDDQTQRAVSYHFQTFEERFGFIFKTYSSGNSNAFIFSNIEVCIDALLEISGQLIDYAGRYKQTGMKTAVSAIRTNLLLVDKQMELDKRNVFMLGTRRQSQKVRSIRKTSRNEKIQD